MGAIFGLLSRLSGHDSRPGPAMPPTTATLQEQWRTQFAAEARTLPDADLRREAERAFLAARQAERALDETRRAADPQIPMGECGHWEVESRMRAARQGLAAAEARAIRLAGRREAFAAERVRRRRDGTAQ